MLTIGELAARAGVPTSTLRYYDRRGLVPAARAPSGHRRYPLEAVRRLSVIASCQQAGFSLEEIAALLDGSHAPGAWQELARSKLEELEARITELERARDLVKAGLACACSHLEQCEAASHLDGS